MLDSIYFTVYRDNFNATSKQQQHTFYLIYATYTNISEFLFFKNLPKSMNNAQNFEFLLLENVMKLSKLKKLCAFFPIIRYFFFIISEMEIYLL